MDKDIAKCAGGLSRRGFLRGAGIAAACLAASPLVRAQAGDRRELSFVHTHTGERLTTVYYEGGGYKEAALAQVNQLLRDFRTETVFPIDPKVLDRLFLLQVLTGNQQPYEVISGYRSPATNAALREASHGVAEHSLHMQGRAIDVRLEGIATKRLVILARQQVSGGVGFYRHSDFAHLDTGAVRNWGDPVEG